MQHDGIVMRTVVIDCETYLIGAGRVAPTVVSTQLCDERRDPWIILGSDPKAPELLGELFDECLIIGHNLAYDMGCLAQMYPQLQESIWRAYTESRTLCTMVLEKLIHIAHGWEGKDPRSDTRLATSLAALVKAYLGEDMEGKDEQDSWRFRYRELDGVPLDQWDKGALKYALNDALSTWDVFQAQKKWQITNDKVCPDVHQRTRGHWALHLMGAWGLRTDPEKVDTLARSIRDRVSSARVLLKRTGLVKEDGRKDLKEIRSRVEAAYKLRGKEVPITAKGSTSTAREILEASGDPDLGLLASISNDEKLLTTYVPVLEQGKTLPVNASYNPVVNTGRTSCRKPNVQNQPRLGGVRECWVPREGNVYVQADYSIAELCALAQCCIFMGLESKMAEALNEGKDLHLDFASNVLGISYDQAIELKSKGDKSIKNARQMAKIANFGIPGGLSSKTLVVFAKSSYGVELSEPEAKRLRADWLRAYPEMQAYFRFVRDQLEVAERFELRQWRSSRIRGNVGYTDGCNSPFQGLAADFGVDMCFHVARACYIDVNSPLYGSRPVAFVHDEIILESPEDKGHECALELQKIMERRARAWCPDIPIQAEPCIMTRWFKDAEIKYDSNGRIIPWG